MSSLSQRLQVSARQTLQQKLTPGLVQMVSLLQLNRLELKDMITAEIAANPVLEEAADGAEELTAEELQPLLEAEATRSGESADQSIMDMTRTMQEIEPEPPVPAESAEFVEVETALAAESVVAPVTD